MATFVSVIGSEYCLSKPIKVIIDTDKGVTYIDDQVIFRVQEPSFSLHHRRVLRDVSENPILTLYKKHTTVHGRWEVYKCDSTNSDDLLFSVKRSSFRTPHKKNIDLEVFLAKNNGKRVWDFKVNAGADKSSCDVCAYGSSTILAKMTNIGAFEVELQPNVDYAFIVALITIVDEISNFDNNANHNNTTTTADNINAMSMVSTATSLGANITQIANNLSGNGCS